MRVSMISGVDYSSKLKKDLVVAKRSSVDNPSQTNSDSDISFRAKKNSKVLTGFLGGLGAAFGAALLGPLGAVIGGAIGSTAGSGMDEANNNAPDYIDDSVPDHDYGDYYP